MLDVEVVGGAGVDGLPTVNEIERLVALGLASAGVYDGHLAVEFVDSARVAQLNRRFRDHAGPTDVLSFPIDGDDESPLGGERELGDVIICPEHTEDLREAIMHGVLHLVGMDHENDEGEMLILQRELLGWSPGAAPS